MQRLFVTCVMLVLVIIAAAGPTAAGQTITLGVLEDVPGVYSGESSRRQVRAVFQQIAGEWKAFPSACPDPTCLKTVSSQYPQEIRWTISFDGRRLGQVTAETPKEFDFYSHVGLQRITSQESIPTVGKKSSEFGGFIGAPVFRPLIANSKPFFRDPESWRSTQPPSDVVKMLRKKFRAKFPNVTNCANPEENVDRPWPYRDEDIKILKAYSSKKGWLVVRVRLEENRCDGPAEDSFVDQWFAVSPTKDARFLGTAMWLVDAGDYDNDGRSELVFSIDDYNRGGYRLYYDDFKRSATFEFGYH